MDKKKRATSIDVAKAAGVSQSAVSMILNNSPNASFSAQTKKRVWDACTELGYYVKPVSGKDCCPLLLAVCPSYENLYYVALVDAMRVAAQSLGYMLATISTSRDYTVETNVLELAKHDMVAGILFLYLPQNTYLLQQINMIKPIIHIYDKRPDFDMDTIELNSYKMGVTMAEHLLSLGHHRVAYLSTDISPRQMARVRRLEGMRQAFANSGLNPDEAVIACTMENQGIASLGQLAEYETGYLLTQKAVGRYDVTALVGLNDMLCYGIMDALAEQKKRIPQDYSVCGFDNLMPSKLSGISLTTVEHFPAQKGKEAVEVLHRKIQDKNAHVTRTQEPVSIIRIEYEPKLIVRRSTGYARQ